MLPEICNTLVIDGDSIPYMIGWHHRDHQNKEVVYEALDRWMKDFFTLTGAQKYIGILAHPEAKCFRYDIYKYKPYKGTRPEKDEWIKFWEPIIRERLMKQWNFQFAPFNLETDDIVALLVQDNPAMVLCSPDKDLKQIPGWHWNYKRAMEDGGGLIQITEQEAQYNLLMQILCGDDSDNVNGLVGSGPVKAKKLLDETMPMMRENAVKLAYQKQYGPYYGPIIYDETFATIRLMVNGHPLHYNYGINRQPMEDYLKEIRTIEKYSAYDSSFRGED